VELAVLAGKPTRRKAYAPESRYCTVLVVFGRGAGWLVVILTTNHNRPFDSKIVSVRVQAY